MRKAFCMLLVFAACAGSGATVRSIAQLQAEREQVICDNTFLAVLNESWEDLDNAKKWEKQFERCNHQGMLGLAVKGIFACDPPKRKGAATILLGKGFHMSKAAMLALEVLNNHNAPPQKQLEALRVFLANDYEANRFLTRMLSDEARMQLFLQGKPVPLYPVPKPPIPVRDP